MGTRNVNSLGSLIRQASLLIAFALAGFSLLARAEVPFAAEGKVRFYVIANSGFDTYTSNPTSAEKQWMRDHYYRMEVWAPYWNTRLSWNPNVWAYKDAFAIRSSWTIFSQHPEWVLRDSAGRMLYIDWACSGGTCPQFAGDFGNQQFRDWWIAEVRGWASLGYKGLWIDDVNMDFRTSDGYGNSVTPIDPRTGQAMTVGNWRRYMAEFMEQVRAAVPAMEIAHNAIWYAGTTSDSYIRRQIAAADYINLERGINDNGLTGGTGQWSLNSFFSYVDFIHSRGRSVVFMDEGTTTTQREYGLAGWFMISQGRGLMSSENENWTTPPNWWTGWDTDLGGAKNIRYTWNGLLRRDFQCGMVLLNPPGATQVTVNLPKWFERPDAGNINRVTLAAKQGAVLKSACEAAGGGGGGGGCHQ